MNSCLKQDFVRFEQFPFRQLKNSIVEIRNMESSPLVYNHLKCNSSNKKLKKTKFQNFSINEISNFIKNEILKNFRKKFQNVLDRKIFSNEKVSLKKDEFRNGEKKSFSNWGDIPFAAALTSTYAYRLTTKLASEFTAAFSSAFDIIVCVVPSGAH